MLTIDIVCVGKLKEMYIKDAVSEYGKRLSKYCKINVLEVPNEKIQEKTSLKMEEYVKEKEGLSIQKQIKQDSYVICLDLQGKEYSSEAFSAKIDSLSLQTSHITFVIGGSLGLSKDVLQTANEWICFSKMTFPHQLIRVFLFEQIYRAFKIIHHETYHK